MQTIIFFDIDSTIVENRFSYKVIGQLIEEIAAASGVPTGTIGAEIGKENQDRQDNDPDNVLTMDWDDILETVATRHGVTLSNRVIDLWEAFAEPALVDVLDNAPQVIVGLKQPHRKLVIATKGLSKYQNVVLDVTGMRHLFDEILTPDKTGYLKTSPGYFSAYKDQQATFIQVGDHYYDDVMAAKRNGFYAVLRAPIAELRPLDPFERPAALPQYFTRISTYRHTDVLPDAVVLSLEELPEVIAHLESRN